MSTTEIYYVVFAVAPAALMATLAGITQLERFSEVKLWNMARALSFATLLLTALSLMAGAKSIDGFGLTRATTLGQTLAVLVQLLGTVIGVFSARYLDREQNQRRYICALAMVLTSVHLLLIADHWLLLIAAWASVGLALQHLLCFYPDRSFAILAAHKKRIADRLADLLLMAAAVIAWREVGSGSLSILFAFINEHGVSTPLQASAVLLALAVILRTALLPVHGWIIQVMEAPTPVSALLHAGVVNLGGFVLIRFSSLLDQATVARYLLLIVGLLTAVAAGMVMLTRVSIKVRLAWSTVAQMGFMVVECALGLTVLAALHIIGHSLYKAHAFLSASEIVRQTRLQTLNIPSPTSVTSLVLAPLITLPIVHLTLACAGDAAWPMWWSSVLGLAWAPLLWLPSNRTDVFSKAMQVLFGLTSVICLTLITFAAHLLPLGLLSTPHEEMGFITLVGMTCLYFCQAALRWKPHMLSGLRRWSYAGFYLDEAYTRLALKIWPTVWTSKVTSQIAPLDQVLVQGTSR